MTKKTSPIKKEKEVKQNPDPHIDQDFPGFPHAPSQKKHITPKTKEEKKKRKKLEQIKKNQRKLMGVNNDGYFI